MLLTMFDAGLTLVGLNLGVTELNPLIESVGSDIFEFRMATVAIFIILYALLAEKYPWGTSRALWLVLIIMSFVVLWNVVAISDGVLYG